MSRRYDNRPTVLTIHNHPDLRKKRGLEALFHYSSPAFKKIPESVFSKDNLEFHVWKVGDRFYKLAAEHYGDARLWWIIAFFNKKPTDGHAKIGDIIYIPSFWEPIYDALTENNLEYPL